MRLGFVATSPSEGEEEENGSASMMCGRGESHKGVVNRRREAGQPQTGWDAATTRPVPRSLGPRRKNKVARVDPRTPTSLETARPPLAMSHAWRAGPCTEARRGDWQTPRPPKAGWWCCTRLRAVVLEEISLQRSTASDPSSTVDRRRAAGERSVLRALLRRGLGGGRRSDVGGVSDGRLLSDGRGLVATGTFRLTQLGVAWRALSGFDVAEK